MKKIAFILFVSLLCYIMSSCNYTPSIPSLSNEEQPIKTIDTSAMIADINSFETQPINKLEIFQVFEDKGYSSTYKHNYKSCLARSYKYNKNHRYKFDEYEEVNSSSLYITFDDKVMLYDELEIFDDDFIMIDTYSYDTRGGKAFGIEVPSQRVTVPVYVKRSDLLKLFGN
jgi:hypothetical protein